MTILLCTSLRPSPRTRTFCNDLVASSSDFKYFARGKSGLAYLAAYAKSEGGNRLWIVNSRYGGPKLIECYDTSDHIPRQISSLLIHHVQLRREMKDFCQADTRQRRLRLVQPDSISIDRLYKTVKDSLGCLPEDAVKSTELHIIKSNDYCAELFFVDNETKLPSGPAIYLWDYRC